MIRRRTGRLLLVALLPLMATLASCGDDDDDDAGGSAASDDVEAYCEAVLQIETVEAPDIDFESASPEEIKEGVKEYASDKVLPLAKDVQEVAPEEIAPQIDRLVEATEELSTSGDFEAEFGKPEVVAAEKATHEYDLENCGWGQAKVTASEYAFAGIEKSYDEGIVSFDMSNGGKEMHELSLGRKKDGTTQSFDELLSMSEEEVGKFIEMLGGLEPTAPGEDNYFVAELKKGDYIAVCFLPVGATPEVFAAVESGEGPPPEGPPHALEGMTYEFTVE